MFYHCSALGQSQAIAPGLERIANMIYISTAWASEGVHHGTISGRHQTAYRGGLH